LARAGAAIARNTIAIIATLRKINRAIAAISGVGTKRLACAQAIIHIGTAGTQTLRARYGRAGLTAPWATKTTGTGTCTGTVVHDGGRISTRSAVERIWIALPEQQHVGAIDTVTKFFAFGLITNIKQAITTKRACSTFFGTLIGASVTAR
jgi:hypothetical protein